MRQAPSTDSWVKVEQFTYTVHNELTMLRVLGIMGTSEDTRRRLRLVIERGRERRLERGANIIIDRGSRPLTRRALSQWHAHYVLPLEVIQDPRAEYRLITPCGTSLALPVPEAMALDRELEIPGRAYLRHARRHVLALTGGFAAAAVLSAGGVAVAGTTAASPTGTTGASTDTVTTDTVTTDTATTGAGSTSPQTGSTTATTTDTSVTTTTDPASATTTQGSAQATGPAGTDTTTAAPTDSTASTSTQATGTSTPPASSSSVVATNVSSSGSSSKAPAPRRSSTSSTAHHAKRRKAKRHHTSVHHRRAKTHRRSARHAHHRAARHLAPKPSSVEVQLPSSGLSLLGSDFGVDPFTAEQISSYETVGTNVIQPPRFLVHIFKAAARRYHVPWQILAAINAVETDYGRNLNVSPAGAIGWMQFEPETWLRYGVRVHGQGAANPYDPSDAIFSAAHYLAASGAPRHIRRALFAYNRALWYVDVVLWRAQLISDHAMRLHLKHRGYALPLDKRYMKQLGRIDDGLDIEDAPDGAAVYSITPGIVTAIASDPSGFGPNYPVVLVTRGPLAGQFIYYGHVAAPLVRVGQKVVAGQPLAIMGHTGDAAGLGHGHIEIGFSDGSGDPLNHGGSLAWTPSGDAMRQVLLALNRAFRIKIQ